MRLRGPHGHRDLVIEGRPGLRHDPDRVRLAKGPGEGNVDPGGREPGKVARRVLDEGPVGVIHLHLCDGHRLGAAGPHEEVNAGVVEDAALERQPLDGRRAVVEGAQRIGHHEPGGRQPEQEQGQR